MRALLYTRHFTRFPRCPQYRGSIVLSISSSPPPSLFLSYQVLSTDEGDSHIPRPEVTSGLLMVVEIKLQLSFFVVITTRASRP